MVYNDIKHILPMFDFKGTYEHARELTSGNINSTYKLTYRTDGGEIFYTLQKINKYVFKNPHDVMRNISRVTDHLRKSYIKAGEDPDKRVLRIINTRDGDLMYQDQSGAFWRAYLFISDVTAYDAPEKPEHIYETGRAFGEFQRLLCDFPAGELSATIPDFHNTSRRFFTFVASVASDRAGRAQKVDDEIEFMFEHRKLMNSIVKMLESGKLPARVTHNDTKINNVLIDNATQKAVCIIDLDTVMPGTALYDYGDGVRYAASTAAEDEPDTSKIKLDMDAFRLFTRGFLAATNGFLTRDELRALPMGALVITCELAMRFLTDYIDGDMYFKVQSPEHNLIRARAQMALLRDMESKYDEMCRAVDEMIGG